MMMRKMKRLSMDSEYSVNQPAKNSSPYRPPARIVTRIPNPTANPMYTSRWRVTSGIDGSCGRRPMTTTSSSRMPVVTTTVAIHNTG
jgi:hypothetical protein